MCLSIVSSGVGVYKVSDYGVCVACLRSQCVGLVEHYEFVQLCV